jgi:hypothetical protein
MYYDKLKQKLKSKYPTAADSLGVHGYVFLLR